MDSRSELWIGAGGSLDAVLARERPAADVDRGLLVVASYRFTPDEPGRIRRDVADPAELGWRRGQDVTSRRRSATTATNAASVQYPARVTSA